MDLRLSSVRKTLYPLKLAAINTVKLFTEKKLVERAANPYTTHLPVLIFLGRLLPIKRVLELGCGEFSTPTFLDKQIFPDLVALSSFETDAEWRNKILTSPIGTDERLSLSLVPGEMNSIVSEIDIDSYDLVFIDDSLTADSRSMTIVAAALKKPQRAVFVIHDFEVSAYKKAADQFKQRFAITAFNPNTGVVWNDANLNRDCLQQANGLFSRHASLAAPEDINYWLDTLNKEI